MPRGFGKVSSRTPRPSSVAGFWRGPDERDAVLRQLRLGPGELLDRRRQIGVDGHALELALRGKPGPAIISGTRAEPS